MQKQKIDGAAERFLGTKEFLLEKLYEYMRKKQHIDRLIYSFDCMEELYVEDDIGD